MKKIIGISLITIITMIFLISFIEIPENNVIEKKENFTFSIDSFRSDLKEVGNIDKRIQDIICATSKGLIELDSNNNIIPALAESVDVRDNGLEYSFNLKEDMYWSDGRTILAKDVLSFFREIITEENEDSIKGLLNVYGAKDYRNNKNTTFSETVGIYIEDNNIVFRLNSRDDNFIKELSKVQYRLRNNVALWEDIKSNYSNLIYSGNYSIENITNEEIILKSNKKDLKVERINIITGEETEVAMAAFEIGTRDIVLNPPKSQLNRLEEEKKLITTEDNTGIYLSYNGEFSISDRKYIYSYMLKAIESYQLNNSSFIDLAEGSYVRSDKEDLTKLQERKVMANNLDDSSEINEIKEIYFAAKDNVDNKDILEYLSNWFLDNTDIFLDYNLLSDEEFKEVKNNNYYDMILFECNIEGGSEMKEYEDLIYLLPEVYTDKMQDKTVEELKIEILKIDEELYDNFQILPLAFFKKNIATNSIDNINFDINGNIDFNKINKS